VIGALIIVLREVIEAGLIVGIVLAVTKNIPRRMPYILGGLGCGLVGSGLVAGFAGVLSNALQGVGQEVFNASILAVAVVMLIWHNAWMARHGQQMGLEVQQLGQAVRSGTQTLAALAIVIGVAVLREGSEVVLFLYGILISDGISAWSLFVGGILGLIIGIGISTLTFAGLVIIPMRHLFRVTSILISFMAAGMAAQSVAFLEQADIATKLSRIVWNTTAILPESSIVGRVLHALLGYNDQPTELQLLVYLATLAIIFLLMKLLSPPPKSVHHLATN
jgi:high-affinity iron transporter